jgi:serine/threonine protein kinase
MDPVVFREATFRQGILTVRLRDDFESAEPVEDSVLSAGERLGKYRIRRKLGRGGMADIYEATDTFLRRRVALKVLRPKIAACPKQRQRFEREARALAALNHPNILTIHDFCEDRGLLYVVAELLQGETLRQRLEKGALPRSEVLSYAHQIAEGLAEAHEQSIVHRDLKPENIFITNNGRLKILDFGLSKQHSPLQVASDRTHDTNPGMLIGTVAYMAPEQLRGETTDHRTDIFAFGTILLEMLTGKNPFRRESPVDTIAAILKEDPVQISARHSGNRVIVGIAFGCVQKCRQSRTHSMHEIALALPAS